LGWLGCRIDPLPNHLAGASSDLGREYLSRCIRRIVSARLDPAQKGCFRCIEPEAAERNTGGLGKGFDGLTLGSSVENSIGNDSRARPENVCSFPPESGIDLLGDIGSALLRRSSARSK
jgi:hypothetical protein